jgi:hypothetical protein
MLIVVPIKEYVDTGSIICPIIAAKRFAFVQLSEDMQIESIEAKDSFENELFDYIVTPNKCTSHDLI